MRVLMSEAVSSIGRLAADALADTGHAVVTEQVPT
jgi:hypothetical protein